MLTNIKYINWKQISFKYDSHKLKNNYVNCMCFYAKYNGIFIF